MAQEANTTVTYLEMKFRGTLGNFKSLRVPDPKKELKGEEVREAMQKIGDSNILIKDGEAFTTPVSARLITTNHQDIPLVVDEPAKQ